MADIEKLSVLPRPRSSWQAIDAGFSLARAHYGSLLLLWLGFSIPLFALTASLQFFLEWHYTIFVWWWFKPLYELPLLFFLSKALFSEHTSLLQAWNSARKKIGLLLCTYLSISRLSNARTMSYGVVFLENATFKQRGPRMSVLSRAKTRVTTLLLSCLHIEYLIAYLAILLLILFFPGIVSEFDISEWFLAGADDYPHWLLLSILFGTFLAAALVAPFYVAAGFLLYINRRMELEAWDIEHRFRKIGNRSSLTGSRLSSTVSVSAAIVLVAMSCASMTLSSSALAQQNQNQNQNQNRNTLPDKNQSRMLINEILESDDFGGEKIKKFPRLKDKDDEDEEESEQDDDSPAFEKFRDSIGAIASSFKIILWMAIIAFIALALYTAFRFRDVIKTPRRSPARSSHEDAQSHPLTTHLPADIAKAAREALQNDESRMALSLLFRGALRSVMTQYDMSIKRSATEADCKSAVSSVASKQQKQSFERLIKHWQQEAYANTNQPTDVVEKLIEEWTHTFSSKTNKNSSVPQQ